MHLPRGYILWALLTLICFIGVTQGNNNNISLMRTQNLILYGLQRMIFLGCQVQFLYYLIFYATELFL